MKYWTKGISASVMAMMLWTAAGCENVAPAASTAKKEETAPMATPSPASAAPAPSMSVAAPIKETAFIQHDKLTAKIGRPAVLSAGDAYPAVKIQPQHNGTVSVRLVEEKSGKELYKAAAQKMEPNKENVIAIPGKAETTGTYKIEIELAADNKPKSYDYFYFTVPEKAPDNSSKAAFIGPDGRMAYVPDYKGNRIPDFSGVGYMGGGVALPDVPVKVTVEPSSGDSTRAIQDAINEVSRLPLDSKGFRGAVLLKKGVYEIGKSLEIKTSGVVLRGEGQGDAKSLWLDPDKGMDLEQFRQSLAGKDATILLATGKERRRILKVHGSGDLSITANGSDITDLYVPAGTHSFHVDKPELFKVGEPVVVQRAGNAAWISEIKMDKIPPRSDGAKITQWTPFKLDFEHFITNIEGNRITIDSTLVNAIEARWGGGKLLKVTDTQRINQVGIENLRAIAYWQPNKDGVDDTRHSDEFLDMDNMKNGWVRNVTTEHFTSINGSVRTGKGSKWITMQDSSVLSADKKFYSGKGYDSTGRTFAETNIYVGRYGFYLNGQSALVMRSFSLNNRHSFTLGSRVTGPNVFVDCIAEKSLAQSEPHHRWSVGGLFDNVHDAINLMNRHNMGSGHGWAGANYVAWNTEGTLVAHQPPTAQNWAIGHVGKKDSGGNRGPDGFWDATGKHVAPRSLYLQQLQDRMGADTVKAIGY